MSRTYWFSHLVPEKNGLMKKYTRDQVKTGFLVAKWISDKPKFALFSSFVPFAQIYYRLEPEHRHFYEVILGDMHQKPHFDLDIATSLGVDGDTVLYKVLDAICKCLDDVQVALDVNKDICIYTSHTSSKWSYHVVIQHWYHTDHHEAKALFLRMSRYLRMWEMDDFWGRLEPCESVDQLRAECAECTCAKDIRKILATWDDTEDILPSLIAYSEFLDHAVYGSSQQFRLMGSCKPGKSNTKKLVRDWTWKSMHHVYDIEPETPGEEFMTQFEESLVAFTKSCRPLPTLIDDQDPRWGKSKTHSHGSSEVTDDVIHKALDWYNQVLPEEHFDVRQVEERLIRLERTRPTPCQVCGRSHEHENPFITISEPVGSVCHVNYHCGRSDKSTYLGAIMVDRVYTPSPASSRSISPKQPYTPRRSIILSPQISSSIHVDYGE